MNVLIYLCMLGVPVGVCGCLRVCVYVANSDITRVLQLTVSNYNVLLSKHRCCGHGPQALAQLARRCLSTAVHLEQN